MICQGCNTDVWCMGSNVTDVLSCIYPTSITPYHQSALGAFCRILTHVHADVSRKGLELGNSRFSVLCLRSRRRSDRPRFDDVFRGSAARTANESGHCRSAGRRSHGEAVKRALLHRLRRLENRYTPAVVVLYCWEYPDGQGAIGTRAEAEREGITKLKVLRPLNANQAQQTLSY
jgi:hypothetical protein